MPNVYFIGSAYLGCWYVRCLLPMLENGWQGSYSGLSKASLKDPKTVVNEALKADIIVFHRPNTPEQHKIAITLKQQGKKIVFDNDDTYLLDNTHAFMGLDEKGYKQNKKMINTITNNFVRNADLVTTSTKVLAQEYKKINPNVIVLPNYVQPNDWDEPLRSEGDKVRIGLVGSVMYHQDFEVIKNVIKKLDESDKIQLVLFGLWTGKKRYDNPLISKVLKKEYEFWDSLKNKEQMSWCDVNFYPETLNQLRLDIMLIPRRGNYFNKCKSNLKFLEASMLEIPVIASSFEDGPYEELDGQNGIIVKDEKDWEEVVMSMVNNKSKRRMMGMTAKKYVLNNYDIKDHAQEWVKAYSSI